MEYLLELQQSEEVLITFVFGNHPIKENTLVQPSQITARSLHLTGCWVYHL